MADDTPSSEEPQNLEEFPSHLKIKREYTLSDIAIKARRHNARLSTGPTTPEGKKKSSRNSWKHGLYAQSFIMGVLGKTCKSTCNEFATCQFIVEEATTPGDKCLDRQHMVEAFGSIIDAIEHGDHTNFKQMAAFEMAGGIEILRSLKQAIIEDGVVIKSEKHNKDGVKIGYEYMLHPALNTYNQMLEKQGLTFKDFALTPKEKAKIDNDDDNEGSLADKMASSVENLSSVVASMQKNK